MCVCFILMSIKQRVQHCTDGREGGKQEAKLPLMFRCCSFSYLEVHQCGEGNIQLRNSDPLQAAGMNTERNSVTVRNCTYLFMHYAGNIYWARIIHKQLP